MKGKNIFAGIPPMIMILLLCFPKISLEGARCGLLLWYQTVLPTLLPFMVCTNLIVSMNGINYLTAPAAPLLKKLAGLSDNGCFILLNGLLCGYPMGAKTCSDFFDQGCITAPEAKCLYAVSSFPSPMFLAGYMAEQMKRAAGTKVSVSFFHLAASIYLPIIPMFLLASRLYGFQKSNNRKKNKGTSLSRENHWPKSPVLPLDEALTSSIEIMVKIGGYLMLFSILAQFMKNFFPEGLMSCLLLSAAEMTTGMHAAGRILSGLPGVLLILAAGAFGGFCSLSQVKSVTKNAGLSIRHYLLWKIMHSLLAVAIFLLIHYFTSSPAGAS